jgi:hypothetical protein
MKIQIDGWTFEVVETIGCLLRCEITSPARRTASCMWLGSDGRLSKHRTEANIEFASMNLKLSESLVDRIISAVSKYSESQCKIEPEFGLVNV